MKLLNEKKLNIIRGKMLVAAATQQELRKFLMYVSALETLLDETNQDDYFGTEGWQHHIGIVD